MWRPVIATTVLIVILTGCGSKHPASESAPTPQPTQTQPTAGQSNPTVVATHPVAERFPAYAVTAAVPTVAIRSAPDGPRIRALANPGPLGVPLTFLLKHREGQWLQVYLPVRPDGSTGWVRSRDVTVAGVPYRIDVHQATHQLDLYRFGRLVRSFPVGVGKTDTPTPGGVYYLKELLRPPDPQGFYGPFAFGLSGFSTVLHSFDGGAGVIGIHGTSDPTSVGHSESHGCIRMRNADIRYLAHLLPLGTPVRILT